MFTDRKDAGRQLAKKMAGYTGKKCVVYALPRGGVPVAYEISVALNAPLETIIVKKLGVPGQEELALGAVAEGEPPTFYYNESLMNYLNIQVSDISETIERKLKEIHDIQRMYRGSHEILIEPDAVAIIVDDGIATGATMKVAINFLRKIGQKKIVVAVPAGEKQILEEIRRMVDEVICVNPVGTMYAVGEFYSDFSEIKHEIVIQLLAKVKESSALY